MGEGGKYLKRKFKFYIFIVCVDGFSKWFFFRKDKGYCDIVDGDNGL